MSPPLSIFDLAPITEGSDAGRVLLAFAERTGADKLILTSQIYDHVARLRSFEIVASELLRARAA
jgi:hypothetical protein